MDFQLVQKLSNDTHFWSKKTSYNIQIALKYIAKILVYNET